MIVEAGHFALALALALSLVQAVMPIWARALGRPGPAPGAPRRRRSAPSPACCSPSRR